MISPTHFLRRSGAIFTLILSLFIMTDANAETDPENTLLMDLKDGQVVIALRPDLAPVHVKRIKELVREKFYDGIVFHRVITGFMAQTGDPTGTGSGGSGKKLKDEYSDEPHVRGTVSMASTAAPNSSDSQFFIVFARARHLDGKYTVWGQVVEGMAHVSKIKRGTDDSGIVDEPDKIITLRVAADVK